MTRRIIGLVVALAATLALGASPAAGTNYERECEIEQSVACFEHAHDGFGNSRRGTFIATVTATNPYHVDAQLVIWAQRGQGHVPNGDGPLTLEMVFVDDAYTTTFEVPSWKVGGLIEANIEGCDGVTVTVEVEKVA